MNIRRVPKLSQRCDNGSDDTKNWGNIFQLVGNVQKNIVKIQNIHGPDSYIATDPYIPICL